MVCLKGKIINKSKQKRRKKKSKQRNRKIKQGKFNEYKQIEKTKITTGRTYAVQFQGLNDETDGIEYQ